MRRAFRCSRGGLYIESVVNANRSQGFLLRGEPGKRGTECKLSFAESTGSEGRRDFD